MINRQQAFEDIKNRKMTFLKELSKSVFILEGEDYDDDDEDLKRKPLLEINLEENCVEVNYSGSLVVEFRMNTSLLHAYANLIVAYLKLYDVRAFPNIEYSQIDYNSDIIISGGVFYSARVPFVSDKTEEKRVLLEFNKEAGTLLVTAPRKYNYIGTTMIYIPELLILEINDYLKSIDRKAGFNDTVFYPYMLLDTLFTSDIINIPELNNLAYPSSSDEENEFVKEINSWMNLFEFVEQVQKPDYTLSIPYARLKFPPFEPGPLRSGRITLDDMPFTIPKSFSKLLKSKIRKLKLELRH